MFVFIIDDSMSSKSPISSLDSAKYVVEAFLAASPCCGASLQLMLLVTGQSNDCLLSAFGDPISLFRDCLKNIECRENLNEQDCTRFAYPISYALSVVNNYRVKSGADTFGHGRAMW